MAGSDIRRTKETVRESASCGGAHIRRQPEWGASEEQNWSYWRTFTEFTMATRLELRLVGGRAEYELARIHPAALFRERMGSPMEPYAVS